MRGIKAFLIIAALGLSGAGAAVAQEQVPPQGPVLAQQPNRVIVQSPVLTVDTDRLYQDSNFGRQTAREFEGKGAELAAENRRIEAALSAEEQMLTDRRSVMKPAEFRVLADAFDAKVQETRKTQDAKTRALNQELEDRRVAFFNAAVPVLEQLMRATGAAVILERRSVFISVNAVDITQEAIQQLNQSQLNLPAKN